MKRNNGLSFFKTLNQDEQEYIMNQYDMPKHDLIELVMDLESSTIMKKMIREYRQENQEENK